MHIETPGERSSELVAALVDVWERSVRATHDFLAEDDIVGLRPEAESGIAGVERLTVAYDGGAHEGFVVAGRSPVDDAGRPFPLLHMRRACDDEEGERS